MRDIIKSYFTVMLASVIVASAGAQTQVSRPNIIFFLVDDLGWNDLSLPISGNKTRNNTIYQTPHIEQLAKQGTVFNNAYTAPVCTPTRVSLITGVNAAHHKITNWTSPQKNKKTDHEDEQLVPADWNINGFSPVEDIEKSFYGTALPQILQDNGYFTIHVGKAHWGPRGTPASSPTNLGFVVNVAGHAAGHPQSYLPEEEYGNIPGKGSYQSVPGLQPYFQTEVHLTDALTQEALKAIAYPIKQKQPFFLNLGHYAVHTPLMADKRYLQKYLDKGLDSIEARYATLVEGVDKSVGDILAYIKDNQLDKNTVFIFMSDNGGLSLTPPRGGEAFTHNLPLKAGKGSVYEGGIRVPLIVKYDGVAASGGVSQNNVIAEDIFPTILEIAGVTNATTVQKVDGVSFVPALKNTSLSNTERVLLWHYPNKWNGTVGPGISYFSALRQGDWKLIYNQRNGDVELYNLKDDIGENKNLAQKKPAKAKALTTLLGKTLQAYEAAMPTDKRTGNILSYPK